MSSSDVLPFPGIRTNRQKPPPWRYATAEVLPCLQLCHPLKWSPSDGSLASRECRSWWDLHRFPVLHRNDSDAGVVLPVDQTDAACDLPGRKRHGIRISVPSLFVWRKASFLLSTSSTSKTRHEELLQKRNAGIAVDPFPPAYAQSAAAGVIRQQRRTAEKITELDEIGN